MNRLLRALLALLAAGVGLGSAQAAGPHVLVEEGQARARIVLGTQASWQDHFAAREVQGYLKKMTGATLPL